MKTKVRKWGNSPALRTPKTFATEIGLADEATVEVTLKDRKLVVEPAAGPTFTLDGLLRRVTKKNLHAEIDTGLARGREAW